MQTLVYKVIMISVMFSCFIASHSFAQTFGFGSQPTGRNQVQTPSGQTKTMQPAEFKTTVEKLKEQNKNTLQKEYNAKRPPAPALPKQTGASSTTTSSAGSLTATAAPPPASTNNSTNNSVTDSETTETTESESASISATPPPVASQKGQTVIVAPSTTTAAPTPAPATTTGKQSQIYTGFGQSGAPSSGTAAPARNGGKGTSGGSLNIKY